MPHPVYAPKFKDPLSNYSAICSDDSFAMINTAIAFLSQNTE